MNPQFVNLDLSLISSCRFYTAIRMEASIEINPENLDKICLQISFPTNEN